MNRSIAECAEELMKYRLLACRTEVVSFEEALVSCAPIVPSLSVDGLRVLIRVFTDSTQQAEVMWGLVHLIETASIQSYTMAVIQELPSMMADAKEWAEIILCRLVNAESIHPIIIATIRHAEAATRQTAIGMLRSVHQLGGPAGLNAGRILQTLDAA